MDILLRTENDICPNAEEEMIVQGAASTIEEKISEINLNKKEDKGTDVYYVYFATVSRPFYVCVLIDYLMNIGSK